MNGTNNNLSSVVCLQPEPSFSSILTSTTVVLQENQTDSCNEDLKERRNFSGRRFAVHHNLNLASRKYYHGEAPHWTHELCDWGTSCSSCFMALCCPSFALRNVKKKLEVHESTTKACARALLPCWLCRFRVSPNAFLTLLAAHLNKATLHLRATKCG
ncbi:unnamed protein product [Oikopleura dioica]|uniref:Uncharacterized protein n=1 Tax=Oikopleura dioica TaxID=34765 RepID=E4X6G8_OIKDI|nr:unnamed protein product [Oikopleura dioica]